MTITLLQPHSPLPFQPASRLTTIMYLLLEKQRIMDGHFPGIPQAFCF